MMEHIESFAQDLKSSPIDRFLRTMFFRKITKFQRGTIRITDPIGQVLFGKPSVDYPDAHIQVHDLRFYRLLATQGSNGAAQAFVSGWWSVDSLFDLVRILVLNANALNSLEGGTALLQKPVMATMRLLSRNTLAGSKKNISAHYDLSNVLFQTFLDPQMMYSCAYFAKEDQSLDDAALTKLEMICTKLNLQANDHLVEIGTGWGGFAIYAAKNYGCHVTTTTISQEQYLYAKARIKAEGLEDKITLLQKDYRELSGQYDKLVSIEMIEAVGAEFLDNYIGVCSKLLKPEGLMLLQVITINDQIYSRALKEVDFIKKYIFPGSFIPSIHAILTSAKNATDLRLYHLEDMTPHYVRTLLLWRERFLANKSKILTLGFDEYFVRLWDYYFSYCAGGFQERSIGSVQLMFANNMYRGDASQIKKFRG